MLRHYLADKCDPTGVRCLKSIDAWRQLSAHMVLNLRPFDEIVPIEIVPILWQEPLIYFTRYRMNFNKV